MDNTVPTLPGTRSLKKEGETLWWAQDTGSWLRGRARLHSHGRGVHTCACGCHLLLPVIASLPIPSPGRQCPVSPSQTPGQTHPRQDYRGFPRTWETHWMTSPSCRRDLSPPVATFSLLIPHLTGPGHPARPVLGPDPPADTVSTCVLGCMLGHSTCSPCSSVPEPVDVLERITLSFLALPRHSFSNLQGYFPSFHLTCWHFQPVFFEQTCFYTQGLSVPYAPDAWLATSSCSPSRCQVP